MTSSAPWAGAGLEATAQQEEQEQQEQQQEEELAEDEPTADGEDQDDDEQQNEHRNLPPVRFVLPILPGGMQLLTARRDA